MNQTINIDKNLALSIIQYRIESVVRTAESGNRICCQGYINETNAVMEFASQFNLFDKCYYDEFFSITNHWNALSFDVQELKDFLERFKCFA